MEPKLINTLNQCRAEIAAGWRQSVLQSPRENPLALPEALVHLIEPTMDRLLQRLFVGNSGRAGRVIRGQDTWPPRCHCGRNPYLKFYVCGERVLMSQLASLDDLSPEQIGTMCDLFRIVALEDIRLFGGVCQIRLAEKAATCG